MTQQPASYLIPTEIRPRGRALEAFFWNGNQETTDAIESWVKATGASFEVSFNQHRDMYLHIWRASIFTTTAFKDFWIVREHPVSAPGLWAFRSMTQESFDRQFEVHDRYADHG